MGEFAAVFVTLLAAHSVGDHWAQTSRQAQTKGQPGRAGARACLTHVLVLIWVKVLALGCLVVATGWEPSPVPVAVGLAVDAASHYWADRLTTLAALATRVGKGEFYRLGDPAAAPAGTGAYALDQSWHTGWLWVVSLIVTV